MFSSGWASGVSAYLAVLQLGVLGRFFGADGVPEALMRTDVMVAAGALYAVEFVTDKIPYVDSAWDAIHTVIRPLIGAVLGLLVAGDADTLGQAVAATVGGVTALASHACKAVIRLVLNLSPEPVTNITASVGEDLSVGAVIALVVVLAVDGRDGRGGAPRRRRMDRRAGAAQDPRRDHDRPGATTGSAGVVRRDEDAERVTGRVGEHVQRLLLVVHPVEQHRRASLDGAVALAGELVGVADGEVEVQLLGHLRRRPGRARQLVDVLDREARRPGRRRAARASPHPAGRAAPPAAARRPCGSRSRGALGRTRRAGAHRSHRGPRRAARGTCPSCSR